MPRRRKSVLITRSTKSDKEYKKAVYSKATKDMGSLQKQFDVKTWKLGTLNARIKVSRLPIEFRAIFLDCLQFVVYLVNKATFAACIVTEQYFMQSKSSKIIDDQLLFGVGGGTLYWYNLISFLLIPDTCGDKGPPLFQEVKKFLKKEGIELTLTETETTYLKFCNWSIIKLHSDSVDRTMAANFIGSSPILAGKVKEHNPELSAEVDRILEFTDLTVLAKGRPADSSQTQDASENNMLDVEAEGGSCARNIIPSSASNSPNNCLPSVMFESTATEEPISSRTRNGTKKRKRSEAEQEKQELLSGGYQPQMMSTYSIIRLFQTLNAKLPKAQQFKQFPKYSHSHCPLSLSD